MYNYVCISNAQSYRHYVISHYPQLGYLDDCAVTAAEREEAERIYGRRRAKSTSVSTPSSHVCTIRCKTINVSVLLMLAILAFL